MNNNFNLFILTIILTGCGEGIGGVKPSYRPKDYDRKLTRYAKTAIPIFNAIDQYKRDNGRLPKYNELIALLPPSSNQSRQNVYEGWFYFFEYDDYTLSTKLGWDPCLTYSSKDKTWIFKPGDGSEDIPIKLNIYATNTTELIGKNALFIIVVLGILWGIYKMNSKKEQKS